MIEYLLLRCRDIEGRALVRPSPHLTEHKHRAQRKLGRGKRKRLPRRRLVHPVHFVEHLARPDFGDEILRVSLAVTHSHLCGFLRNGFVRKDAYEDAPASLDVARHGTASRLDLARAKASAGRRLQAVFTEGNLRPPGSDTPVASLLLLAVFRSSRLKHEITPKPWASWISSRRFSASLPISLRPFPSHRSRPFYWRPDKAELPWAWPRRNSPYRTPSWLRRSVRVSLRER